MNILIYILIFGILLSLIGLFLRRPKFIKMNDEEVEFAGRFGLIILDNKTINEIIISKIQGNLMGYYFDTKKGKFKIDSFEVSESELNSFAINNDITLKKEEGYHSGYVETIYESKNDNKRSTKQK